MSLTAKKAFITLAAISTLASCGYSDKQDTTSDGAKISTSAPYTTITVSNPTNIPDVSRVIDCSTEHVMYKKDSGISDMSPAMMTEQGVQTLRQICAAPETQRNPFVTLYTEQPSGVPNIVRLIDCNFGHVMYQVYNNENPSQTGPGFTTEKAVENIRKICSDHNKAPGF